MPGLIGIRRLRRADGLERPASALYAAAVAMARNPWFYRQLEVPDTLDGRFDMVALHAFLLIDRLQEADAPGPALAQAVFDAMFRDMDSNLREIGVSDLSVGKRVRAMWEAFHGRSKAYAEALRDADRAALAVALARNVWRGTAPEGVADRLASVALSQAAHLARQPLTAFTSGTAHFQPAAEVAS